MLLLKIKHTLKTRFTLFLFQILQNIKSRRRLPLQYYNDNAMLQFAVSHSALAQRTTLSLLKVIASKSYRF
jgi:hypothetical protein